MKTPRNSLFELFVCTVSQLYLRIMQKSAPIILNSTSVRVVIDRKVNKLNIQTLAPITCYEGAPIIMIMRPKASLTDC